MVYSKNFEDGTKCVIDAPDETPQEVIDFVLEMGREIILKRKKMKKRKIAIFSILGFCAAAVSAIFIIRRKLKKEKA